MKRLLYAALVALGFGSGMIVGTIVTVWSYNR